MSKFDKKIDFAVVMAVKNANPNGDPLNGNRPRENYSGLGEISDVCLKRKVRNRLMQEGKSIFVQSDENKVDEFGSLSERFTAFKKSLGKQDQAKVTAAVCENWLDVRTFGQLFAFKAEDKGVSFGIRGPLSIQPAFTVEPIVTTSSQITKSVNSEPTKDGKKSSDTMGMKHRVEFGVYVTYGSINVELANKTGFTMEDAEDIKEALITLFRNDASAARPEGSMEVVNVIWWEHNCAAGQYPPAKVHRSLKIERVGDTAEANSIEDYKVSVEPLEGLKYTMYEGK